MDLKQCARCGAMKPLDEFVKKSNSKDGRGSWCKTCHAAACQDWRSRNGQLLPRRKFTEEQIAEWKAYVLEHGSIKEAAARFGVLAGTMQRYVCGELKEYKDRRDAQIVDLRKSGHSMKEIADELKVTDSVVRLVCKANNLGGKIREGGFSNEASERGRLKSYEQAHKRGETSYKEKAERFGLEYIGGYTHSDGYIKVKHPNCGHEYDLSCITLRDKDTKQVVCPICAEARRIEKEKREQDEAEAVRIERMFTSHLKRMKREGEKEKQRLQRVHRCQTCGKITDKRGCCSAECSRKYTNRVHDQRRRAKLRNAMVDGDIQIAELFRRDRGVCYLCGGRCDFGDCDTREDGTFIAGDNYPSIDHVVPLAAGGTHSWSNVKLAHRYCNTVKSNNLISPVIIDLS